MLSNWDNESPHHGLYIKAPLPLQISRRRMSVVHQRIHVAITTSAAHKAAICCQLLTVKVRREPTQSRGRQKALACVDLRTARARRAASLGAPISARRLLRGGHHSVHPLCIHLQGRQRGRHHQASLALARTAAERPRGLQTPSTGAAAFQIVARHSMRTGAPSRSHPRAPASTDYWPRARGTEPGTADGGASRAARAWESALEAWGANPLADARPDSGRHAARPPTETRRAAPEARRPPRRTGWTRAWPGSASSSAAACGSASPRVGGPAS